MSETFIKERPIVERMTGLLLHPGGSGDGEVTVDDATIFMARFKNGAL